MATYSGNYSSTLVVAAPTATLAGTVSVGSGVALDATNPPQTIVTTADAYIGNGGSASGDIGVLAHIRNVPWFSTLEMSPSMHAAA